MNDLDEKDLTIRFQIEDMVKGLIKAFPNTKYVAFNANITSLNESHWINEWYVVGFKNAPWLKNINGFYAWVETPDVDDASNETGIFFTHFNSANWWLGDRQLQMSRTEFMNEEDLCFYVADDGEVMQYRNEDHLLYIYDYQSSEEDLSKGIDQAFDNLNF